MKKKNYPGFHIHHLRLFQHASYVYTVYTLQEKEQRARFTPKSLEYDQAS